MTDAQISRAHPDLPPELARVAVLGRTLGMAKRMALALGDLDDALAQSVGSKSEIIDAQSTATTTIVAILAQVSEADLQAGLDLELLSPDDHREAVKALRTMALERGRSGQEPELDHDRER